MNWTSRSIAIAALYAALPGAASPLPSIAVCHNWGCKQNHPFTPNAVQWQTLAHLFEPPPRNPAEERQRVAKAIAYMETVTGPVVGTAEDLDRNTRGDSLRGQMDCIDESTNTSRYLNLFQDAGWLHWHRTAPRARRSWYIVDQHYTAVLEERESRRRYAVDSWYGPNGALPEIQPLEDWYRKRRPGR